MSLAETQISSPWVMLTLVHTVRMETAVKAAMHSFAIACHCHFIHFFRLAICLCEDRGNAQG